MFWVPVVVWIAAAVIAVIVLGFCAYEIVWKTKRLRRDVGELTRTNEQLASMSVQLDEVRRRITAGRPV